MDREISMIRKTFALVAVAATVAFGGTAEARDQIRIVGSSTVFPFSTRVAEEFGKTTAFKTPVVESTGTGGGFKLFCGGVGVDTADISNASRAIKKSEVENCAQNGVGDITEIKIGFDGIVLANSKKSPQMDISLAQLFLALAKDVPDGKGGLMPNPHKMWNEIDPSLPAARIEVLGPPPTSGTRDAFNELAMEGGCNKIEALNELKKTDEKKHKAVCQAIREDGVFVEAGENDVLIVRKLEANPNAFGVFGYSFLDQNRDKIQGSKINGVEDTYENISSGAYPISRSLFIYVKKAHVGVIPGIKEYLAEYTSEKAWGPDGYLAAKGLIAMPDQDRKKFREAALNLPNNVGS
jgi:phosphate transport system substrate-binding protein